MTISVTFTGTPLSGTETLSVAFTLTAEIPVVATGGGGNKKKKKRGSATVIRYSDFDSRDKYEQRLRDAAIKTVPAPVQTPAPQSIRSADWERILVISNEAMAESARALDMVNKIGEEAEMMEVLALVQKIDKEFL